MRGYLGRKAWHRKGGKLPQPSMPASAAKACQTAPRNEVGQPALRVPELTYTAGK